MLRGIDISHYQPPMNYTQARLEGAEFIVHKATEGGSTDPTFVLRIGAIKASGAVPGAYHFLRSTPSAVAQVAHFLDVIGDPTGLLIQLDWELSGTDLAPVSMARAWVNEWNVRTGNHPVLIYLPHWVWADHLGSPGGLNTLGPLWASHYLAAPPTVLTLASASQVPASWWAGYGGWTRPTVLQYAGEAGRIAGISGADLNLFDGTLADLQALTEGGDMAFDDTDKERLRQVWAVLGDAYALSGGKSIGELVFEIEQDQESIVKLVGAIAAPQVDVVKLADQLRAHLGPDLVAALGAQLVK